MLGYELAEWTRPVLHRQLGFQSKSEDDWPFIFEINKRFSETTSTRAVAGVNEVDLLVRDFVYGEKTKCEPKRLVGSAYSEHLFLKKEEYCKASFEKRTAKRGTIGGS